MFISRFVNIEFNGPVRLNVRNWDGLAWEGIGKLLQRNGCDTIFF